MRKLFEVKHGDLLKEHLKCSTILKIFTHPSLKHAIHRDVSLISSSHAEGLIKAALALPPQDGIDGADERYFSHTAPQEFWPVGPTEGFFAANLMNYLEGSGASRYFEYKMTYAKVEQ